MVKGGRTQATRPQERLLTQSSGPGLTPVRTL